MQNIGHEHVLTTFTSYDTVPAAKQAELIRGMAGRQEADNDEAALAAEIARLVRQHRGSG